LTKCSMTDDPKVPIHLLAFAVQAAITTSTCIADYLSWSNFSKSEKIELGKLYVSYLALCEFSLRYYHSCLMGETNMCAAVFMAVDMFGRLDEALSRRQTTGSKKNL
jgi:hypothetical protein